MSLADHCLIPAGGRTSGEASTSGQSSGHHSPSQDFRLAAVRPGHDQGEQGALSMQGAETGALQGKLHFLMACQ